LTLAGVIGNWRTRAPRWAVYVLAAIMWLVPDRRIECTLTES
jgi:hypothetical protein